MNILVINCGSSSLKFQLIDSASEKCIAKGNCERIGIDGRLTYQPEGGAKTTTDNSMPILSQIPFANTASVSESIN